MDGNVQWPSERMVWETVISVTVYSGDLSDIVDGANERRSYFIVICHAFKGQ